MKNVFENIMNRWKENEKVFVSYYNNANEILEDGIDKETLNETYYIWGNESKPSELQEPFIIVEVSGAVDTPIFTEEYADKAVDYLEDNHKEYIK